MHLSSGNVYYIVTQLMSDKMSLFLKCSLRPWLTLGCSYCFYFTVVNITCYMWQSIIFNLISCGKHFVLDSVRNRIPSAQMHETKNKWSWNSVKGFYRNLSKLKARVLQQYKFLIIISKGIFKSILLFGEWTLKYSSLP